MELADVAQRQEMVIPETINAEKVEMRVTDAFPGTLNDHVCLAEVRFWHSPDQ